MAKLRDKRSGTVWDTAEQRGTTGVYDLRRPGAHMVVGEAELKANFADADAKAEEVAK